MGCFGAVIRCPYHHWTYGTYGALRGPRHLADLDRSAFGLLRVELDSWGGLSSSARILAGRPRRRASTRRRPARQLPTRRSRGRRVGSRTTSRELEGSRRELQRVLPLRPRPSGAVRPRAGVPARRRDRPRLGAVGSPIAPAPTRSPQRHHDPASLPRALADELVNHKGELVYRTCSCRCRGSRRGVRAVAARPARTTMVCDFLFHPDELAEPDFDPSDAVELLGRRQPAGLGDLRARRSAACRRATSPTGSTRRWRTEPRHPPLVVAADGRRS